MDFFPRCILRFSNPEYGPAGFKVHGLDGPDKSFGVGRPFFSNKIDKGLGLGLAISRRIIEDHRGMIDAQSHEGKGATFSINLPLEKSSAFRIFETSQYSSQTIDVLGLSKRVHNCLIKAGIIDLKQLLEKLNMGDEEILTIPGIGPKSLDEVNKKVQVVCRSWFGSDSVRIGSGQK